MVDFLKKDHNIFHFFVKKSWHLDRGSANLNFQYMDIGIALCHFELAASELSLKGSWELFDNIMDREKYSITSDMEYIISWDGSTNDTDIK